MTKEMFSESSNCCRYCTCEYHKSARMLEIEVLTFERYTKVCSLTLNLYIMALLQPRVWGYASLGCSLRNMQAAKCDQLQL